MGNIATEFIDKVKARRHNFNKQWKGKMISHYSTFNPFKDY